MVSKSKMEEKKRKNFSRKRCKNPLFRLNLYSSILKSIYVYILLAGKSSNTLKSVLFNFQNDLAQYSYFKKANKIFFLSFQFGSPPSPLLSFSLFAFPILLYLLIHRSFVLRSSRNVCFWTFWFAH